MSASVVAFKRALGWAASLLACPPSVHLSTELFLAPAAAAPRTNLRKFSLAPSYLAAGLLARRLWSDNPMPASLAPLRYPVWCTRLQGARIVRPVACSPQRSALTRLIRTVGAQDNLLLSRYDSRFPG